MFLAGERAYKLKKPLVLDFLDYVTPARRREMCREEVRLNRRRRARARKVSFARGAPVLTVERRFERNLHDLLGCVEQRGELDRGC